MTDDLMNTRPFDLLLLRLLALFVILLPASVKAIPTYEVTDLGFEAFALNDRGEVVGRNASGAVIWAQDSGQSIIGPGEAIDINNFGRVVGRDGSTGWIWDPTFGRVEPAGLTYPAAINDKSQIVGQARNMINPAPFEPMGQGYHWDPVFGFTTIGDPIDSVTVLTDINNSGDATGWERNPVSLPQFWDFSSNELTELTSPSDGSVVDGALINGIARGKPTAINESGDIVAAARLPSSSAHPDDTVSCDLYLCYRAVIWQDFEMTIIAFGEANDLNDLGQVVGGRSIFTSDEDEFSFLWSDSLGLLNLNDLVSPYDPLFG